jgi:hypothetical protein
MARKQPNPIVWAKPPEQPKGVWRKEYNRDTDREAWELTLSAGIKLWVSNGHIDYRGEWIVRFYPLADSPKALNVKSADEAKDKALEYAKAIIEPIYKLLEAAE